MVSPATPIFWTGFRPRQDRGSFLGKGLCEVHYPGLLTSGDAAAYERARPLKNGLKGIQNSLEFTALTHRGWKETDEKAGSWVSGVRCFYWLYLCANAGAYYSSLFAGAAELRQRNLG